MAVGPQYNNILKRIIFLTVEKLSKYNYKRYGVDLFISRKYKVEIWDLSPVLRRKYNKLSNPNDTFDFNGNRFFENKIQLLKEISLLSEMDKVIWALVLTPNRYFLYEHLRDIAFGFFFVGALPKKDLSIKEKILFNNKLIPSIIWNKIKNIFIKRKNMHFPSFIITGGELSTECYNIPLDRKTKIIKGHAFDYDRFLELESSNCEIDIKEPFTLYIDQNIPYHPDNIYGEFEYGVQGCLEEKYFPEINRFFDWFEHEYKTKIIVAAHPSSNYTESDKLFGERILVSQNTELYVKYADSVMIHDSTAVNFAVLYKKPLIFIKSNNYSFALNSMTQIIANALGLQPINISREYSDKLNPKYYSIDNYNDYKRLYIKENGTPEKQLWDIVIDNFEEYYGT